jgi:hypothetical protein
MIAFVCWRTLSLMHGDPALAARMPVRNHRELIVFSTKARVFETKLAF